MSASFHIPGRPKSSEPERLVELVQNLYHPKVARFGVTSTHEGDWALLVVLKNGAEAPIAEIENAALTFPVIYLDDHGRLPVARPAFPSLGE